MYGPSIMVSCDPLTLENSYSDKDMLCFKRLDTINEVLLKRKSRAMEMMNGGSIEQLVVAPSRLLTQSRNNAGHNVERQIKLDLAKTMQVQGTSTTRSQRGSRYSRTTGNVAQANAVNNQQTGHPQGIHPVASANNPSMLMAMPPVAQMNAVGNQQNGHPHGTQPANSANNPPMPTAMPLVISTQPPFQPASLPTTNSIPDPVPPTGSAGPANDDLLSLGPGEQFDDVTDPGCGYDPRLTFQHRENTRHPSLTGFEAGLGSIEELIDPSNGGDMSSFINPFLDDQAWTQEDMNEPLQDQPLWKGKSRAYDTSYPSQNPMGLETRTDYTGRVNSAPGTKRGFEASEENEPEVPASKRRRQNNDSEHLEAGSSSQPPWKKRAVPHSRIPMDTVDRNPPNLAVVTSPNITIDTLESPFDFSGDIGSSLNPAGSNMNDQVSYTNGFLGAQALQSLRAQGITPGFNMTWPSEGLENEFMGINQALEEEEKLNTGECNSVHLFDK